MATIEQLKEIIIELKVDAARARVPYGHCPYAYYTCIENEEDCDDCNKCMRNFFEKYESLIRQEVEEW
jgi:hypothetical protein